MSEKKLDCAIVQDLLPLYHDEVVSEVTKTAVAEHLSECADCAMEYLKLSADLPEEPSESPKKTFRDLLRTRRKYRILTAVTAVILLCGLLIGGFFLQSQFPVVQIPGEEFTIERVYRYETEEEIKYFLIVTHPLYGGMRIEPKDVYRVQSDGSMSVTDDFLTLCGYRPLISWKHGMRSHILVIDCGWETVEDGKHDYARLTLFGKPIDPDELVETAVPEYVYEYDRMMESGGGCELNVEENWIGICYGPGEFRYWDLDGNPLPTPPDTVG